MWSVNLFTTTLNLLQAKPWQLGPKKDKDGQLSFPCDDKGTVIFYFFFFQFMRRKKKSVHLMTGTAKVLKYYFNGYFRFSKICEYI